ncbi:MAG TPA: glycosyltransferase [Candidatus Methylomirabilis sp.]|nr:glycosyltransferase [Candidatus Methylomirabilis sp.]
MVRVSVIVPTRDRPGPLAACLAALAEGFPAHAETIVVSDGGAQDLRPVVAPFVERLRLRLLAIEHAGPAAARNRGLELACGDIVAFTDDDCRPHPGWVATLAGGVSLSPPRAVGGTTLNGLPGSVYADTEQLVLNLLSRHDRAVTRRERLLPSNNLAFPREPLRRLGGFDERFRTAEDRELCRRWASAGFALGRVPAAVVEHDSQLDLRRFVRKFVAYGRGAARFHGSGGACSLWKSAAFHVRLPVLLAPELRRRGPGRAVGIVGLLVLWEIANLLGFLAEWSRWPSRVPEAAPADRRAGAR